MTIILPGDDLDPFVGIRLQTKRRRDIPNYQPDERSPYWHEEAVKMDMGSHPEIVLRNTTAVYNCLGLVFAARRTWIEGLQSERLDEIFQMIVEDDELRPLRLEEAPVIGDLLIYRNTDGTFAHIGTVVKAESNLAQAKFDLLIMSKWGKHGEYIHRENDVSPRLGTPSEIYTDRE